MAIEEEADLRRAGSRGEARRAAILQAAIDQFAAQGIARTSMARIAEAAGVSRPALYQYFSDKDEIFASAFVGLFEQLVDGALAALDEPGTTVERLDGFLQRYEGDLYERMLASRHLDEITGAKNEQIAAATHAEVARLYEGLGAHLASVVPGRSAAVKAQRAGWVEMLRLAPQGFRADQPTVDVFRNRLTDLANVVAAAIDAA